MNVAIIPAAGQGRRMGGDRAKQFLELCGDPIIVHTLRRFEACASIDAVIVAAPEGATGELLATIERAGLRKVTRVVPGGAERQESVAKALAQVRAESTDVVVVHDAVRPFVTPAQITEVTRRASETGAAILALLATDTVKQIDGAQIVATLDRRHIALAQTPQAFRLSILRDAYARARTEGWAVTDDSSLVEQAGHTVEIVAGSAFNLKITRPEDLELARFILETEFASERPQPPGHRERRGRRS